MKFVCEPDVKDYDIARALLMHFEAEHVERVQPIPERAGNWVVVFQNFATTEQSGPSKKSPAGSAPNDQLPLFLEMLARGQNKWLIEPSKSLFWVNSDSQGRDREIRDRHMFPQIWPIWKSR